MLGQTASYACQNEENTRSHFDNFGSYYSSHCTIITQYGLDISHCSLGQFDSGFSDPFSGPGAVENGLRGIKCIGEVCLYFQLEMDTGILSVPR
jgi:hypothetical protein